jgi:hypothetical protein
MPAGIPQFVMESLVVDGNISLFFGVDEPRSVADDLEMLCKGPVFSVAVTTTVTSATAQM